MELDEHRATNWRNWQERVAIHARSNTYDLDAYARDPKHLSNVVDYDAPFLGDLSGLDAVHLQCHIGTDTVSLARLGARITGVDFSPAALDVARELAATTGIDDARFVESELYDAPRALGGAQFDLVYTGVGALCWLPDIAAWARVVAALLRPGGRLYLRDGHPVLWAMDDERTDDALVLTHPYFERTQPNRWVADKTYTDGEAVLTEDVNYEWNHGLGEIVTAVLDAGLTVSALREHQFCEWAALPWMVPAPGRDKYKLPEGEDRLPLMFTLEARRPA